jgi:hypothetical protein
LGACLEVDSVGFGLSFGLQTQTSVQIGIPRFHWLFGGLAVSSVFSSGFVAWASCHVPHCWAAASLLSTPNRHSCSTTYGGALSVFYSFFFFLTTSIKERIVDNFNIFYTLLYSQIWHEF